mmetsp:Transcript_30278/g.64498  ORF Transcript_30278/g.64498 Transcript_30278/m.64498 type:complete len:93 (+) Transcript_30278:93-371(+)
MPSRSGQHSEAGLKSKLEAAKLCLAMALQTPRRRHRQTSAGQALRAFGDGMLTIYALNSLYDKDRAASFTAAMSDHHCHHPERTLRFSSASG